MTPASFPEQTVIFAKDQPQYLALPAHVSAHGVVTTCWEFSVEELCVLLKTKRIWLQTLTYGQALQPQRPSVEIPIELG